jgi:hypothetical protein
VRIVIGDLSPALLEQLHDAVAGRLAFVVHIGFVSQAENEYARSIDGFAQGVQGFAQSFHDVAGHRGVDLACQLDKNACGARISLAFQVR